MDLVSMAIPVVPMDIGTTWNAFVRRLMSDWWRLTACVVLAIGFGAVAFSFVNKKSSVPTGIGTFWLIWQLYNNFIAAKPRALFRGEPSIGHLYTDFWQPSFLALLFGLSLAVGILVFIFAKKNKDNEKANIVVRILTGFFAFSGMLLVFRLIVNAVS